MKDGSLPWLAFLPKSGREFMGMSENSEGRGDVGQIIPWTGWGFSSQDFGLVNLLPPSEHKMRVSE